MRHNLALRLALAIFCVAPLPALAAPPPIDVTWQAEGTLLNMADLDPSPGLEVVVGGLPSGRITVLESMGGTAAFELPAVYGNGLATRILIEDFDGVDFNELFVWYHQMGGLSYYGMFWHDGVKLVPRWEVASGLVGEPDLTSADVYGDGKRQIVAWDSQSLRIIDPLIGVELYDSSDLTPQLQVLSVIVLDIDGDAIDELLVTANDTSIPALVQAVIEYTPSVNVEPALGVSSTMLRQNAPNPFRGPTRIAFTVPQRSHVKLRIYDVSGRLVRGLADESRGAGSHEIAWDGRDLSGRLAPSGSYFYELEVDGVRESRRMVRLH